MWRRNVAHVLILTLASALLTPNCATVIWHKTQGIPVTSSPAGATVIVNGVQQGMTPLVINLPRKQKGQVIRVESPGHNTVEIRTKRRLAGSSLFGNFAAAGGLGFLGAINMNWLGGGSDIDVGRWGKNAGIFFAVFMLVDLISGSGYELKPTWLNVALTKADGPPRVDTMVVDADDFLNIKWIRVRRD